MYIPPVWNGILLLGDLPSAKDIKSRIPFRGSAGLELRKLCLQAGIEFKNCALAYGIPEVGFAEDANDVFLTKTNWQKLHGETISEAMVRPRTSAFLERTRQDIRELSPKFILGFGKLALFTLQEETNLDGYRGSMEEWEGIPCTFTFGPDRLFKQWHLRNTIIHDIRRPVVNKFKWPEKVWKFITNPTFEKVTETLDWLLEKANKGAHISCDIETRWARHISYIGFGWSDSEAICIPFIRPKDLGLYWNEEQEYQIVLRIKKLLECETIRVSGQNYHYDSVYLSRNWGIRNHIWCDTMVWFHSYFSRDIPKNLAMLGSLFCDYYKYWKDESENHEPTVEGELAYQEYNCKDCCITWEVAEKITAPGGLCEGNPLARDFQAAMWYPTLEVMLRGTRYDLVKQKEIYTETREKIRTITELIQELVPPEVYDPKVTAVTKKNKAKREEKYAGWWSSPAKVSALFYDFMGIKPVTSRNAVGRWVRTSDDDALKVIGMREPLLSVLTELIAKYRSLCKFLDFANSKVSTDGRMRTSYQLAGPVTYRFASSIDQFDEGMNLQNLPKGDG